MSTTQCYPLLWTTRTTLLTTHWMDRGVSSPRDNCSVTRITSEDPFFHRPLPCIICFPLMRQIAIWTFKLDSVANNVQKLHTSCLFPSLHFFTVLLHICFVFFFCCCTCIELRVLLTTVKYFELLYSFSNNCIGNVYFL